MVLDDLRALVDQAGKGRGRVVLLRGEAGIGKTAVVRALTKSVAGQAHILWGSCDDLLAPRPFGPIVDMAFDDPGLQAALNAQNPVGVFGELMQLFTRALRPTVSVFEDVHWSDGATLDLLTSLGRRIDRTHTLMVLTLREPLPTDHPISIVLGDLPPSNVRSIELQPLSRDAVMSLSGDEERGSRIWELSDGNPFLVTELLESAEEEIPASVTDAVRAQLSRLTGKVERLVKLVSVVPGRTELLLIESIDSSLNDAIGETDSLQLLKLEGGNISFHHELARSAVERTLAEPERRLLNALVLRSCESLGFDVSRSAHHARQANDVSAMIRLLPKAAREAAQARSHREAVLQLEALSPYLDKLSPGDRADVHKLWATEEGLVSGRGIYHAVVAAKTHRSLGDPKGFGASLLSAARSGWFSNVTEAEDSRVAFELAKRTVDEIDNSEKAELVDAYAYLAHHAMVRIQHDDAITYANNVLELSSDASATRCIALLCLGVVKNEKSYPDGNLLLTEAREMADSLGLQREWWWAQLNLILGAAANKEIEAARAYNDATKAEIVDDDLAVTSFHISKVAEFAISTGDYVTAESTLEALSRNVDDSVWWFAWSRALLDLRIGRSEFMVRARRVRSLARALDEPHPIFHASTLWAELLFVHERKDAEVTRENLETLANVVTFDVPSWIADLSLWLWLDGHIDRIPKRASEPVHWIASGQWEKAADWYLAKGIPYEQAVVLSLGDRSARLRAVQIADRIGAKALGSKFRRQLRAEGVKGVPREPRNEEGLNPLGLSARQDDVLSLLAQRLTNAEIADRLFISPRTVEKHVAAVIAKLDAADRREVVALARDAGWRPSNG